MKESIAAFFEGLFSRVYIIEFVTWNCLTDGSSTNTVRIRSHSKHAAKKEFFRMYKDVIFYKIEIEK